MAPRIVAMTGILIVGNWITGASATELEKLVMPGPVVIGHADIEANCDDCHMAFSRANQSEQCMACHEEVAGDVVEETGYHGRDEAVRTAECASCHTDHLGRDADIIGLDEESFDHELTDFGLSGTHVETECVECHADDQLYREAPSLCYDCHAEDDSHGGGLGEECDTCHRPTAWDDNAFDHREETGYALTGSHDDVECAGCHVDDVYENTPTDCYGCHAADDTHEGLNGVECEGCHDTRRWDVVSFDHAETGFVLRGRHAEIVCADCHVEPVFEVSLATDCYSCHEDDDPHAGQLGEACQQCHGEVSWTESVAFDHDLTVFPLIGAHRNAECEGCHEDAHFKDAPGQCIDCHREDDVHEMGLGPACGDCHNPVDWPLWKFDHNEQTSFEIDGAHAQLTCESCHNRPVDAGNSIDLATTCVSCHRGDDVHRGEFGVACERCHTTRDFRSVERIR